MRFLLIIIIIMLISRNLSITGDVERKWQQFKLKYNKKYRSPREENYRKTIFTQTLKDIAHHKRLFDMGLETYEIGITRFADMTQEEFSGTRRGLKMTTKEYLRDSVPFVAPENIQIPDEMDWRKAGIVTEIKDQGGWCGSCWAFSTTGSLECHHALKTGRLIALSEQQLLECSSEFDNNYCVGGLPTNSFDYIKSAGGIASEESYPYDECYLEDETSHCARNRTCDLRGKDLVARVAGYVVIEPGSEELMRIAVATVGPITVGMDSRGMHNTYISGVYPGDNCANTVFMMDHSVLIIGYGTDPSQGDYWLVKNSWSTDWGENGFFKIKRNVNACGFANIPVYPIMA